MRFIKWVVFIFGLIGISASLMIPILNLWVLSFISDQNLVKEIKKALENNEWY